MLAVDDLLSRRNDGFGSLGVEQVQLTVDLGRCQLDAGDGMDEGRRHRLTRHWKILHRTLGLGAIESRGRHPQLPHAVAFDTMIAHVTPSLDDRSLHHGVGNRGLQAFLADRARSLRSPLELTTVKLPHYWLNIERQHDNCRCGVKKAFSKIA